MSSLLLPVSGETEGDLAGLVGQPFEGGWRPQPARPRPRPMGFRPALTRGARGGGGGGRGDVKRGTLRRGSACQQRDPQRRRYGARSAWASGRPRASCRPRRAGTAAASCRAEFEPGPLRAAAPDRVDQLPPLSAARLCACRGRSNTPRPARPIPHRRPAVRADVGSGKARP